MSSRVLSNGTKNLGLPPQNLDGEMIKRLLYLNISIGFAKHLTYNIPLLILTIPEWAGKMTNSFPGENHRLKEVQHRKACRQSSWDLNQVCPISNLTHSSVLPELGFKKRNLRWREIRPSALSQNYHSLGWFPGHPIYNAISPLLWQLISTFPIIFFCLSLTCFKFF